MTRVTEEQVLRALETVTDFDRGADVVSLGMISGLVIEDGEVRFVIEVAAEDGAAKKPLRAACVAAVRALPGVESVSAVLTNRVEAEPVSEPGTDVADTKADGFKESVIEALRTVYDPEIPVSIYDLGLVYRIDVDGERNVAIEMTLTAPGCPVAGSLPGEVEERVRQTVSEVGDVQVNLVWDPPWTTDRMSEAARLELGFM